MEFLKAVLVLGFMIFAIVGSKHLFQKAKVLMGKKKNCSKEKCGCG